MHSQGHEFDRLRAGREGQRAGLCAYLASIYVRMAGGCAVSAGATWSVAHDATLAVAIFTPNGLTTLGWCATLAPLGLVLLLSARINRLSARAASLIFIGYAVLVGLSLGGLMLAYSGASLVTTFLAGAVGFTTSAAIGGTSRRPCRAWRSSSPSPSLA